MNKTKIEWTDYTWNPVTGCKHGCEYCYARRISQRFKRSFEPQLHPTRLSEPYRLKKPSMIFTVSMGDLMGGWVPEQWNRGVIEVMEECPEHIFQILTKNPIRYQYFNFPKNAWLGATIDRRNEQRMDDLNRVVEHEGVKFFSFEPLLEDVGDIYDYIGDIDWIIIGRQTGAGGVRPDAKWVYNILSQADNEGIPVFIKDNVEWGMQIQEFPQPHNNTKKEESG